MAWIGIADHDRGWFAAGGLSRDGNPSGRFVDGHELLARGSLMIETRLSPDGRPQTLLSLTRHHPWVGQMSLQAIPGGGIALVLAQGTDVFHSVLRHGLSGRADVLRITFSWDAPRRWGRLAIEHPESDAFAFIDTRPPPPLMLEDIRVLVERPSLREMDRDVLFLAVSDEIEPLGPMPTLAGDVPVATSAGYCMAGRLRRGDLVRTRDADLVPVLHTIRRTVPGKGSFLPVRLRAPYFGLQHDIVVAPDQRLVIDGSMVEYMFGHEAVLVPARHLVNDVAAIRETGHLLVDYCQVVLPGHEAILAAGTAIESLYVGRIRRKPEKLAASLLARIDRGLLPEHAQSVYPVLKPFEAITLAENRAA